jgi:toxin YoeB
MSYEVIFSPAASKEIQALKRSNPQAFGKVAGLLAELQEHPKTGMGHPKPLGGNKAGQWSRRITQKHRLVYQIGDEDAAVLVLSAYGHYDDK